MKRPYSPLPPVLFEDEDLAVFDKPGGLLVAPDRSDKTGADLLGLLRRHGGAGYGPAHDLDRETSGALIVAKTAEVLREIRKEFDADRAEAFCLALTADTPVEAQGVVEAPIAPDRHRPGRMRICAEGAVLRTRYEAIERFAYGYALVRARPERGRTQQVRLHLRHIGCPVVGDTAYGRSAGLFLSEIKPGYRPGKDPERPLVGFALYVERIAFRHPRTQQVLTVEAPLPKHFAVALKYLRRFAGAGSDRPAGFGG